MTERLSQDDQHSAELAGRVVRKKKEHDARAGQSLAERHDERLPRERRLRSAADFAQARQRGRWINSAHLTLSFAPRPAGDAPTRVGFSVSKRVGDAVRRNLVKRRLREQVRRLLWNVPPGWDMIITARPGAAQVDFATLGAETIELLTHARLIESGQPENP